MQIKFSLLTYLLFFSLESIAVPADGGYEGNVSPKKANPPWSNGNPWGKSTSIIEWSTVYEGILVQKDGAPGGMQMYLAKNPFINDSYTVEIRFRITRDDYKKVFKTPLYILISKKGAGYHWLNARLNQKDNLAVGSKLLLDKEYYDEISDSGIKKGEWIILRLVVEDKGSFQKSTVSINGKVFQEIEAGARTYRGSYFVISSPNHVDGWEIDYIRWINEPLPISEKIEKAVKPEEREIEEKKRKEEQYKIKFNELFK